jgi:hypothetical protein
MHPWPSSSCYSTSFVSYDAAAFATVSIQIDPQTRANSMSHPSDPIPDSVPAPLPSGQPVIMRERSRESMRGRRQSGATRSLQGAPAQRPPSVIAVEAPPCQAPPAVVEVPVVEDDVDDQVGDMVSVHGV